MNINIVTLFPEFFNGPLSCGLMKKALDKQLITFNFFNPRKHSENKRQTIDDRPYGGGPGMVMLLDPLVKTLEEIGFTQRSYATTGENSGGRLLIMSPRGRVFNQKFAEELATEKNITIVCGRYEGFDARITELFNAEEVSVGDFVLNGGEAAAINLCEASTRLIPGFMGHEDSGAEESFSAGLLEYPQYTRPENYHGLEVPEVLLSGDHARINAFRKQEALKATWQYRPEMLENATLTADDMQFIRTLPHKTVSQNLYVALLHYPVLNKDKKIVTVSLTNLDIHDIARSSCSYTLGAFFVVTPLADQHALLQEMLDHWVVGAGAQANPDRKKALEKVVPVNSLEDAINHVTKKHGMPPQLWGSSAQGNATINFDEAKEILYKQPAILLLGTGHGLAPHIIEKCTNLLAPLRWASAYNHFSVRCAGTVLIDRILGELG